MASRAWYAVRVRAGSQRMARAINEDTPDHKQGETIIERECRQEGVAVFMPAVWLCVMKHRAKRFTRRRVPLFTGYAFVNITEDEFEHVRNRVDSITSFLRKGRFAPPAVFDESVISKLAFDDFERYQESKLELEEKQDLARRQRIREIRSEQSRIRQRSLGVKGRRRNKTATIDLEEFMAGQDAETQAIWNALDKELKSLEAISQGLEPLKKIA